MFVGHIMFLLGSAILEPTYSPRRQVLPKYVGEMNAIGPGKMVSKFSASMLVSTGNSLNCILLYVAAQESSLFWLWGIFFKRLFLSVIDIHESDLHWIRLSTCTLDKGLAQKTRWQEYEPSNQDEIDGHLLGLIVVVGTCSLELKSMYIRSNGVSIPCQITSTVFFFSDFKRFSVLQRNIKHLEPKTLLSMLIFFFVYFFCHAERNDKCLSLKHGLDIIVFLMYLR